LKQLNERGVGVVVEVKRTTKSFTAWPRSSTLAISLMLCMLSCGHPISMVLIPQWELRMGPMVDPQGLSLRTKNSYNSKFVVNKFLMYTMFGYAYLDGHLMSLSKLLEKESGD